MIGAFTFIAGMVIRIGTEDGKALTVDVDGVDVDGVDVDGVDVDGVDVDGVDVDGVDVDGVDGSGVVGGARVWTVFGTVVDGSAPFGPSVNQITATAALAAIRTSATDSHWRARIIRTC
jgi:hypothetical protein